MFDSLSRRVVVSLCLLGGAVACHRQPPPITAQVDGQFEIDGLHAPVRVVRDKWGVPHIYAESQDDLFVAQGFVQAEDRLFQMDLWRRSVQGRLAQVLGPNFIQRDVMTKRIQYRGDPAVDWASYGADTQAIASAFVRGINAWVAVARGRPSEEFRLAGWEPEFWNAADLLNRTDAFVASGNAITEVEEKGLNYQIADVLRRVGTRPFVIGLEGKVQGGSGDDKSSAAPPVSREVETAQRRPRSASKVSMAPGTPLTFTESGALFENPSRRYLVHLHAPSWNVIGATRPWLPGVAMGHNERVAWGMAPYDADTQDIYEEPLDAPGRTRVRGNVIVSHRRAPVPYQWDLAPRGGVIAINSEEKLAWVLRWSGSEPGTAAELASLALDRAASADEFRGALARWKMPPRQVVYADAGGNAGSQAAGLIPIRRDGDWEGWMTLDDLPHSSSADAVSFADGPERLDVYPSALFAHLLGINPPARRRFNVGPLTRPDGDDGPVRTVLDPSNWDRSRAVAAPGQSESPASAHFNDLAQLWSRGEMFPLVFSDAEVAANAQSTLTLIPRIGGSK